MASGRGSVGFVRPACQLPALYPCLSLLESLLSRLLHDRSGLPHSSQALLELVQPSPTAGEPEAAEPEVGALRGSLSDVAPYLQIPCQCGEETATPNSPHYILLCRPSMKLFWAFKGEVPRPGSPAFDSSHQPPSMGP